MHHKTKKRSKLTMYITANAAPIIFIFFLKETTSSYNSWILSSSPSRSIPHSNFFPGPAAGRFLYILLNLSLTCTQKSLRFDSAGVRIIGFRGELLVNYTCPLTLISTPPPKSLITCLARTVMLSVMANPLRVVQRSITINLGPPQRNNTF